MNDEFKLGDVIIYGKSKFICYEIGKDYQKWYDHTDGIFMGRTRPARPSSYIKYGWKVVSLSNFDFDLFRVLYEK